MGSNRNRLWHPGARAPSAPAAGEPRQATTLISSVQRTVGKARSFTRIVRRW